jgi:hypothetical protein
MSMRQARSRRAVNTVLLLGTFGLSTLAHAQLGGALRRAAGRQAERKVEERVNDRVQAANLIEPTFDATTVEITPERFERYSAELTKLQASRRANQAESQRLSNVANAQRDSAGRVQNRDEERAYQAARERYGDCREAEEEKMQEQSQARMQQMSEEMQRNPVAMQRDPKMKAIMQLSQEMSAASQRGDQAAMQSVQRRIGAILGIETDSAAFDAKIVPTCGARPRMPASMIAYQRMRARADSTDSRARSLMGRGMSVPGSAVGMTDVQSRMFYERIASWSIGMRQDAPITRTFSRAEYDLLVSKRSDIRRLFSSSGGE